MCIRDRGELEPVAKCRGDKKAVDELIRQVEKTGFKKGKLRLGHTENPELMEIVKDRLKNRFPLADIVTYETGGPVSYTHLLSLTRVGDSSRMTLIAVHWAR